MTAGSESKVKTLAWTFNPRGGVDESTEMNICTYMQKAGLKYKYVVEHASQRHMHIGVIGVHNSAVLIRRYLSKNYPETFPWDDRQVWLKSKTWYKPVEGQESWDDYMAKDNQTYIGHNLPVDYKDLLADNLSPEERRKRDPWPEMSNFEEKFSQFDLPHDTFDQVDKGIAMLAYVHRVIKPPDMSKLKGFTMHLWKYLNKDGSGALASVENHLNNEMINRKRKRLLDDAELRDEYVRKALSDMPEWTGAPAGTN